ncbi:hypothetical protein ACE38W_13290 [Chitinophaga sp. Hz27]|uniref:hypothetical protein n=1 Tax=Chitinophaga sp. Hz27 TaxID=3347169 RepID=UPI0035D8129A
MMHIKFILTILIVGAWSGGFIVGCYAGIQTRDIDLDTGARIKTRWGGRIRQQELKQFRDSLTDEIMLKRINKAIKLLNIADALFYAFVGLSLLLVSAILKG